jgi:hypothetical protein
MTMVHAPKTLGSFVNRMTAMAANAPVYEQLYGCPGDPEGEFAAVRAGLENIRAEISEQVHAWLAARVEENWQRLQTGDPEDLWQLKFSFYEMGNFLKSGKYKDKNIPDEYVKYTSVR